MFNYDEWLLRFCVSLAWRQAVVGLEGFRGHEPARADEVSKAIESWATFLLGKETDPGPYEHHVFFVDFIQEAHGVDVPVKFHWYLLRAADGTIVSAKDVVFIYIKLPGILFLSGVQPTHLMNTTGTLVGSSGTIGTPQEMGLPGFGEFLLDRSSKAAEMMKDMSERQRQRMLEIALKDPSQMLSSHSFEVFQAEEYWKRKQGQRR